uniref:Uncharacterized protein n=1 Tax=Zea mays TaxID=4577 RepID=C4IY45_MAIZE|nr:unknown [Zea mays]
MTPRCSGEMGAKDLQRGHLLLWPSLIRYHVPHSMDDECLKSPTCRHCHYMLCCALTATVPTPSVLAISPQRPCVPLHRVRCTSPAPQFIQSRLESAMHRRAATAMPGELEQG